MKSPVFEVCLRGSHALVIPDEFALLFLDQGHKRVQVSAAFGGKSISFHAALQKYNQQFVISFGKRYQKQLGVFPNDYFQLQLMEDSSKYGVDMPEELAAVLSADDEAHRVFHLLTEGKIRSLIYMISRYKNSQTRIDKSIILTDNLKRGIRDHKELLKPA
ncbi:MAG: YdeI/OmpD-associated family protein [Flavobacteriaceae bacterium]